MLTECSTGMGRLNDLKLRELHIAEIKKEEKQAKYHGWVSHTHKNQTSKRLPNSSRESLVKKNKYSSEFLRWFIRRLSICNLQR